MKTDMRSWHRNPDLQIKWATRVIHRHEHHGPCEYGLCLNCGFVQACVDHEARNVVCDKCNKPRVWGALRILGL